MKNNYSSFLSFYLYLFFLTGTSWLAAESAPQDDTYVEDSFDTVINNQDLGNKIETRSSAGADPAAILRLLAPFTGILGQDIYERTNPLNKRELYRQPMFMIFHTDYLNYCSFFKAYLFYNQTTRVNYTKCCSALECYLALTNDNLLDAIAEFEDLIPIDVPQTLALFKNVRVEERQVGFMFQWLKNWNKISLELMLPFYYQERNINLTDAEINDIKTSEVFQNVNSGNVNSEKEMQDEIQKRVVSDQFGFGDLFIKIGYLAVDTPKQSIKTGVEITVPTAFALKKGILGGNFTGDLITPDIDLSELINILTSDDKSEAEIIGADILSAFAQRLGAMILQIPLGDYHHPSLALFIEPTFWLHKYVHINSYGSLRYVFPATERRFFLQKKDPKDFIPAKYEEDANSGNLVVINDDLAFLEQAAVNTLFPSCFSTYVNPGFVLQLTVAPHITIDDWHFIFGYDFWYKQRDKFEIYAYNPGNPDLVKAQKPAAYQSTIFARLYKEIPLCGSDFAFAVQAEETIASSGIGRDFGFAASIEFKF